MFSIDILGILLWFLISPSSCFNCCFLSTLFSPCGCWHIWFVVSYAFTHSRAGIYHLSPGYHSNDEHKDIILSPFLHSAKMKSTTHPLKQLCTNCSGICRREWRHSGKAYLILLNATSLPRCPNSCLNLHFYQWCQDAQLPTCLLALTGIHICKVILPHPLPITSLVTALKRSCELALCDDTSLQGHLAPAGVSAQLDGPPGVKGLCAAVLVVATYSTIMFDSINIPLGMDFRTTEHSRHSKKIYESVDFAARNSATHHFGTLINYSG